jgi:hypothetical protein
MRKTIVASVASAAIGVVVGSSGMLAASAASGSNTTSNTLYSAKCYHHVGVTAFHWVSKDKRYEMYTAGPHVSNYNSCHA